MSFFKRLFGKSDQSMELESSPHEYEDSVHVKENELPEVKSSWFIPGGNGSFVPYVPQDGNGSFNAIAKSLGYDENLYYSYFMSSDPDIAGVGFEAFSGKLIFVSLYKETSSLHPRKVKNALKEYSFEHEFDYHVYKASIDRGIELGNIKKEFMSRVLNQDSDSMIDNRFNVRLNFIDGLLVSMTSLDNLSTWAKDFKEGNPEVFNRIKSYAEDYSVAPDLIEREISLQIDALANTPQPVFDVFPLFNVYGDNGSVSVNYVMCAMACCHHQVNLEDFKLISHGQYIELEPFRGSSGVEFIPFSYMDHILLFNKQNGDFVSCTSSGEEIGPNSNINLDYLDKF